MMTLRLADERGHADHGWLNSYHSFSFANYYDPRFMGFRNLRVINQDRVAPGMGFPTHPHRDMEIISYVLDGALEHRDSMGTGSIIRPNEVQRMSAGTGVTHSEYNHSKTDQVHFLQIWITPDKKGLKPGYEQKAFSEEQKLNKLLLVASPDGAEGSVSIHQDARLFVTVLENAQKLEYPFIPGRYTWLQVARGSLNLNGALLKEGDGAAFRNEKALVLEGDQKAEVLIFDLA